MGGLALIFEKSPLFCRRRGIFLYRNNRLRRENKKIEVKCPLSVPNHPWFSNPRIDTAIDDLCKQFGSR